MLLLSFPSFLCGSLTFEHAFLHFRFCFVGNEECLCIYNESLVPLQTQCYGIPFSIITLYTDYRAHVREAKKRNEKEIDAFLLSFLRLV